MTALLVSYVSSTNHQTSLDTIGQTEEIKKTNCENANALNGLTRAAEGGGVAQYDPRSQNPRLTNENNPKAVFMCLYGDDIHDI